MIACSWFGPPSGSSDRSSANSNSPFSIRNFDQDGILLAPSALSGIAVTDTYSGNNGGVGILVMGSGAVSAVLNRVAAVNSFDGIRVSGDNDNASTTVTVADSVASGNGGAGISAESVRGNVNLMVTRTVVANNNTGIQTAGSPATLWIGQSTVTGNGSGWINSYGVLASFGTNQIVGNAGGQAQLPAVQGGSN